MIFMTAYILQAQPKEVVAYFTEWGAASNYYVKNIESSGAADIITVINYAFAVPAPDSLGRIEPSFMSPRLAYGQVYTPDISIDGIGDDSTQALRGHFNQLRKLKQKYPHLRILISIGGWTGSVYFSDAAKTPESREYFVDKCIDIFIKGNLPDVNGAGGIGAAADIFDGIDIDWEYPVDGGIPEMHHLPNDNDNLSKLFQLFREKLDEIDPHLLLTTAVPAPEKFAANYNITQDQENLDWFCLMTYDFYGGWDTTTGHLTNLYNAVGDPKENDLKGSIDKTIKLFRDQYNVEPQKLMVGAAFYGRGLQEVDSVNNGLFQPGKAFAEDDGLGFRNYSYVDTLLERGFRKYWDESAQAGWLYNTDKKIFFTYDDVQSIALKARYVDAYNLGGIMFWEIGGDDKNGTLVRTIKNRNVPLKYNDITNDVGDASIKIINPEDGENIKTGTDVLICLDTTFENISMVEFFIDSISIGYSTEKPFSNVWFNAVEGTHTIKAAIKDSNNNILTADEIKVSVQNNTDSIEVWQYGKNYAPGEMVLYNGNLYKYVMQQDNYLRVTRPSDNSGYWQKVELNIGD